MYKNGAQSLYSEQPTARNSPSFHQQVSGQHTMVPSSHNGILHTEQKRSKQSAQAKTFKNHKNMRKKSFCKKKVQRV